jgi:hypothetical protein
VVKPPAPALLFGALLLAGCSAGSAAAGLSSGASFSAAAQVRWNSTVAGPITARMSADAALLKPYFDGTGLSGAQLVAYGARGRIDCAAAADVAAAPDPAVRSLWDGLTDQCTTLFDDVADVGAVTVAGTDAGVLPAQTRLAWNSLESLSATVARRIGTRL